MVEAEVNRTHPTGISSPWRLSENETFKGGENNPCVCEHDQTRLHWLLNC
jgi:hypothetical protein